MEFASRDELKMLLQHRVEPCVSILMPTHRAGAEIEQDPIRLSNLTREAERRLIDNGMRAPVARDLLNQVNQLVYDNFFWRQQADGLAIFLSPHLFRTYRLPVHFDETVMVNNRFYIKPLLRLFNVDGRFYVLALSQREVRLLQCTRFGVSEVQLEGIPKGLEEALHYDVPDQEFRGHTMATSSAVAGGGPVLMRLGEGPDNFKADILQYFLKVNDGLHQVLREERAPLVLAGVDYLLPIYREASTYSNLLNEGITGNPDGLSAEELHVHAWNVVRPYFSRAQEHARARFMDLVGTGLASSEIEEVVPASYFGRVDTLFVPVGLQRWGAFDPGTNRVYMHQEPVQGDEDLLDFAATHAFLNGGTVYTVEPERIPGNRHIAAIFRY